MFNTFLPFATMYVVGGLHGQTVLSSQDLRQRPSWIQTVVFYKLKEMTSSFSKAGERTQK